MFQRNGNIVTSSALPFIVFNAFENEPRSSLWILELWIDFNQNLTRSCTFYRRNLMKYEMHCTRNTNWNLLQNEIADDSKIMDSGFQMDRKFIYFSQITAKIKAWQFGNPFDMDLTSGINGQWLSEYLSHFVRTLHPVQ